MFLLGSWRLKCKEQNEYHWFISFDTASISESVTKEGNRQLSNEIPWSSDLTFVFILLSFLKKIKASVWAHHAARVCVCVCLSLHLLNKLTELHEIWCQLYANWGHTNLVLFNFLRLEITWRKQEFRRRTRHWIYGLEIMYSNRPSRKYFHEAFIKTISYFGM